MNIELLYFEGCPNHRLAEDRLMQALNLEKFQIKFDKVKVDSFEMAQRIGFCGSPSIRINGKDLEDRTDISFSCRIYQNQGSQGDIQEGAPSIELIRNVLRKNKR